MKYIVSLAGREIEVEVDGDRVTVGGRTLAASLRSVPGTPVRQLVLEGRPRVLTVQSAGRGHWAIGDGGERWEAEVIDERTRHIRSLTGGGKRQSGPGVLRAPMPGLVVRLLAGEGDPVAPGAGVLVLEAMKMENELKAEAHGIVRAIRVRPGEAVEKGQVLVEFA